MSISLLQEAWDALSPNQVLVTLLFAENYTFPDKFMKKIFHLNSKLVKFYFENDVIFLDNIFCFTFDCLFMLQKHSLDTGELRKNIQFLISILSSSNFTLKMSYFWDFLRCYWCLFLVMSSCEFTVKEKRSLQQIDHEKTGPSSRQDPVQRKRSSRTASVRGAQS